MSSCLWNVWKWYRNMSLLRFSSFSFLLHSILLQVIHDCIVLYTISFFFSLWPSYGFFCPGGLQIGICQSSLGQGWYVWVCGPACYTRSLLWPWRKTNNYYVAFCVKYLENNWQGKQSCRDFRSRNKSFVPWEVFCIRKGLIFFGNYSKKYWHFTLQKEFRYMWMPRLHILDCFEDL